jgi:hypothetical protein
MDSFSSLFKKDKIGQLLLSIIFIVYLIMGYNTPTPISHLISSLTGKLVIIFFVVYMFVYTNPILAVLSLFVAFDLIRRSEKSSNSHNVMKFKPSEYKKSGQFSAYNQFPYTLEEEMVKKMTPMVHPGTSIHKASYKPLLENLHNASSVNKVN